MAKNNNLYTVYHSLNDKGAFDERDNEGKPGIYFQEHTEYPKYLHIKGRNSVIVADAEEEAKVKLLWKKEDEAKTGVEEIHAKNKEEMTKAMLLTRAAELGIKADGRTSEKKLAYLIEEAEQENRTSAA